MWKLQVSSVLEIVTLQTNFLLRVLHSVKKNWERSNNSLETVHFLQIKRPLNEDICFNTFYMSFSHKESKAMKCTSSWLGNILSVSIKFISFHPHTSTRSIQFFTLRTLQLRKLSFPKPKTYKVVKERFKCSHSDSTDLSKNKTKPET